VVTLDGEPEFEGHARDLEADEKTGDLPRAKCQAYNPLSDASVIQVITFGWMSPIMKRGMLIHSLSFFYFLL
jgi:hypothetical protein